MSLFPLPSRPSKMKRLTFDMFRRYASALLRTFRPSDSHPSWEDLRIRLGLHPMEALIMGEESVAEAPRPSSQLDLMGMAGWSGNLFLTDRHLLLHFPKRQQVSFVAEAVWRWRLLIFCFSVVVVGSGVLTLCSCWGGICFFIYLSCASLVFTRYCF